MKILVLTPYLPHRRVGHGGGTAVRDLITALRRKHDVMVVSLVRPGEEDLMPEVVAIGVKALGLPFLDASTSGWQRLSLWRERFIAGMSARRSGYPFYVQKYAHQELIDKVAAAVRDFAPDAVQIEYLQMALYCRRLYEDRAATGATTPKIILNSHELGSTPRERRAARSRNPVTRWRLLTEARAWRRLQIDVCDWADTTLCVTADDHERFTTLGGHKLQTVPLGMDLRTISPIWQKAAPGQRETHLFVGSFAHRPNVLAAEFLIRHVWPQVVRKRPDAWLILAGRGSDVFLGRQLSPPDARTAQIEALGFAEDLSPYFRDCQLFVAPLAEGGGIKIKILEAMARGIPIVTTPIGAEGISTTADAALTIVPCDHRFADAVVDLADDCRRQQDQATRARQLIEQKFSWDAIAGRLTEIYGGIDV